MKKNRGFNYCTQGVNHLKDKPCAPTGAFGSAVLYRRKEDDVLVIIKEINMLELSASERQMALNEVNVLALLDHPNIVR